MKNLQSSSLIRKTRIGFHYYQDTFHFKETDLQIWIPELKALNAAWLVLRSPIERAIPESFIRGLVSAGIEPIIEFKLSLANPPEIETLTPLLQAYARWGVRLVQFFEHPNSRISWQSPGWAQQDLIERFVDRYLPLATLAIQNGILPVFPLLEPGGSYWDTAFLRGSLESLLRRKADKIIDTLVIACSAATYQHPLNWGAGGPLRWPGVKPYFTPENEQNQCGFRVFDWYSAVVQATLQKTCPMLLLNAGTSIPPILTSNQSVVSDIHTATNLAIGKLLEGQTTFEPANPEIPLETIPEYIFSCNFWLLCAGEGNTSTSCAWYLNQQENLPVVSIWKEWVNTGKKTKRDNKNTKVFQEPSPKIETIDNSNRHPIQHFLLLPSYEWGVADWHLDVIRPYVKKYKPTIGFSINEASLAKEVLVIGSPQSIPEDSLEALRRAGCDVIRISGDGTEIASQLSKR